MGLKEDPRSSGEKEKMNSVEGTRESLNWEHICCGSLKEAQQREQNPCSHRGSCGALEGFVSGATHLVFLPGKTRKKRQFSSSGNVVSNSATG